MLAVPKRKSKDPMTGYPVQDVKPTSIYLPLGLHTRLRTTAFREGRPMNKVIITAVTEYLRKDEKS
jgi:hypothetical protein